MSIGADEVRASKVLTGQLAGQVIGDGLWVLPGQGNSLAALTEAGVVLLDASTRRHAPGMIEMLRRHTDLPLHAIVYSHGHHGYNAGTDVWDEHNRSRGDEPARRIAHRNLVERYRRYERTASLQARMSAMQFPTRMGLTQIEQSLALHYPTEVFDHTLQVVGGSRPVEAHWAPSEVDDALALWFPADGLLCAGAAVPGTTIPNIGTPLRTQRFTIRWADTLDHLADLGADRLLTEFGELVEGAEQIEFRLRHTSKMLRWLRDQVTERLNAGLSEAEILATMEYPDELFGQPWLAPAYGSPDYIVRDLYREENGWWDRNPTSLHPASEQAAGAARLAAIGDRRKVLDEANRLAEAGQIQLALHVVDLLADLQVEDQDVLAAKQLKAELCRRRASEIRPYVSKSLYRSSARLLEQGFSGWEHIS